MIHKVLDLVNGLTHWWILNMTSSLEGNGTYLEGVCYWATFYLWFTPPFLSFTSHPLEGIKVLLSNAFPPISFASLQVHKYGAQQPWTKSLKPGTERKCPILQICSQWKNVTNRTFMYFKPAVRPGQQDVSKQLFCPWPVLHIFHVKLFWT